MKPEQEALLARAAEAVTRLDALELVSTTTADAVSAVRTAITAHGERLDDAETAVHGLVVREVKRVAEQLGVDVSDLAPPAPAAPAAEDPPAEESGDPT